MEIVYLKNVSFNNLVGIDFNLSNDSKLDDNIFGKNLKITAVAGENGSGKSSLLNYIYKFSNMYYNEYEKPDKNTHGGSDILIYKDDGGELNIKGDRYGLFINEYTDTKINDDPLSCSLIDFDSTIKSSYFDIEENQIFKLIKVLLKKNDILKYFDERFIFKNVKIKLNRNNISYFDENGHPYSNLFFNLKNKIISLIDSNVEDLKSAIASDKFMYSTNNIEYEIKISYIISYLSELQKRFSHQDTSNKEFLIKEENHFNSLTFENMFDIIESFDMKVTNLDLFHLDTKKEIIAIKKIISTFKDQYNINTEKITMKSKLFFDENCYHDYETSLTLNIELEFKIIIDIIDNIESELKFSNFFEMLDFELYSYDENIIFSELSSGEQSLINKYMLILHEVFFNYSDIVLLDEPDILLHPNWTKKFIKKLIDIITNDSVLKEKKLHIIISTHSPFILSDLPKENIIFLEEGKQVYPFKDNEQTFGANIHTLLSHGFFMSDGLMGEFAKGKIEEIKKFYELVKKCEKVINESEKVKNTIKNIYLGYEVNFRHIQSIIGEPFLNTIMKNYLDELDILFYGKNKFLDSEIERLKALKD